MKPGTVVAAKPVTDGHRVRWTLEQSVAKPTDRVRVDWLRFTLPLSAVVSREQWPGVKPETLGRLTVKERDRIIACFTSDGGDDPLGARFVAAHAGNKLLEVLGVAEFSLGMAEDRGQDFYLSRCPILREGEVVGYVMAGSDKSAQQASTVHVNLFGAACLHLSHANWGAVADWIRVTGAWITRCDLAVDIFDGLDITALPEAWRAGVFDVRGQRPAQREAGSWTAGHSRTFYVGRRETGKECRVYEKGHQLFGAESADPWVRAEVEFRNNARVLDVAILERPADFFAGAYGWCADLLAQLDCAAVAQRIPAGQRVKASTARAAASGVARWVERVALPSVAQWFRHGGDYAVNQICAAYDRLPHALRGWRPAEVRDAFNEAFGGLVPSLGQ